MELATKLVQVGGGRDEGTGAIYACISNQTATFRHPVLGNLYKRVTERLLAVGQYSPGE